MAGDATKVDDFADEIVLVHEPLEYHW